MRVCPDGNFVETAFGGPLSRDMADIAAGSPIDILRECGTCGSSDRLRLHPPLWWVDWDLPGTPPMRSALIYIHRAFEEGIEAPFGFRCECPSA